MEQVWFTKYRPKNVDEYVFNDEHLKEQVKQWIERGSFPHLLLTGDPGCGKTSLAKMLIDTIGYDDIDVKHVSASVCNRVENIRNDIVPYVESGAYGDKGRIVILDEGDKLTTDAKDMLRNLVGEENEDYRFILIGNYEHKFPPALKSRFTHIAFKAMPKNEFQLRLIEIIDKENVTITDEQHFIDLVDSKYPDLRGAINALEANTINGVYKPVQMTSEIKDWQTDSIAMMQAGNFREARELLTKSLSYEEYDSFYTMMYENIEVIMSDEDFNPIPLKVDAGLLAIKNAMVDDTMVANREINLAALMVRLHKIYTS